MVSLASVSVKNQLDIPQEFVWQHVVVCNVLATSISVPAVKGQRSEML